MADSSDKPSGESPFGPGERVAVLLALPLAGAYDYRVADGMTLAPGDFVDVPLGRRQATGVVWGPGHGEVDAARLKEVLGVRPAPPLPGVSRRFIDWVSVYTLAPPGAVLKMAMSVPAALDPVKPVIAYALNENVSGEDIFVRLTPARRRVLDLLDGGGPPMTQADLAREAACGVAVVTGLLKAGRLKTVETVPAETSAEPDGGSAGPLLSDAQQAAAEQLAAGVGQGFAVTLLDGVPGSGKTEVYFHAVAEALEQGRQVLVLLPEIALSAQWLDRFEARFGARPGQWHSDLSPGLRRDTWRAVAAGRSRVVVGARSALFLPFPELGLIVVDEEHESAFKQEEGVVYNARDMAVVRARLGGIPIVLASATPSLESVVNAETGRYRLLHLPERHGAALLPHVALIDMRSDAPKSGSWLSPTLKTALEETFADGSQAMLFLNRRGYAPLTLCRTCGHRFQCPNCTAWLVEHRRRGRDGTEDASRLVCHHCGFNTRLPEHCPSCDGEGNFAACGPGVERLAEEVRAAFPDIRTALAASDVISGPKAAGELVRQIEAHEVDLVIGTQIVAKGYHFPMLTLVGVVDADLGLSGGDLRAAERTYQLLYQVAGRAGRAKRPGRVLLQTYMPEHSVMQALASGDRQRFIAAETKARREAGMPPFGRLAAVIVSGPDARRVDAVAADLRRAQPAHEGVWVLGPAPAPLAMVRGRHRRRFLLGAARPINVQAILKTWIGAVSPPGGVRIQVDIDPQSFL